MKKLFLILILSSFTSFGQNNANSFPVFPGCAKEELTDMPKCFQERLKQHIKDNYIYPEEAKNNKLKGRAIVEYVIEIDGTVIVTKVEGEHQILNNEAKRIIELLPKMQPAYQNGKPIRMLLSIPISF